MRLILLFLTTFCIAISSYAIPNIANVLLKTNTHIYMMARPPFQTKLYASMGLTEDDVAKHVTLVPIVESTLLLHNISYIKSLYLNNSIFSEEFIDRTLSTRANKRVGRLACFMTHYNTLKLFQSSSYSSAIIFEHDAQIAYTNETQLLYGLNSTNTYPTASSKQFISYTDNEKQLVLLNRMLWMHPGDWDIQYLGYCYECGIANTFPFDIAKRYYRKHGIDAFLNDEYTTLLVNNQSHSENAMNVKIGKITPKEDVNDALWSNYYYAVEAVRPLCAHAYRINKEFTNTLLQASSPRWNKPNELGVDGFLWYYSCKLHYTRVRPIISIFHQESAVRSSELNHFYSKVQEDKTIRCKKPSLVCADTYRAYIEECVRANITLPNCILSI